MSLWTVGELARLAGVTVRALHHYEQRGLLIPHGRAINGYRLYGRPQLERLGVIRLLQQLGMSLSDIQQLLTTSPAALQPLLEQRVTQLQQVIEQQQAQLTKLRRLVDAMRGREATVDELTQVMELLTMFENYYSAEQLQQLEQQADVMDPAAMRQAQAEWEGIFTALRAAKKAGLPASSRAAQDAVSRARAMLAQFTGGDAALGESLNTLYQQEDPVAMMQGFGVEMDAELWAYYSAAMAYAGRQ
ncbi:MAG: hypothetical protein Tsb002_30740 [Wenzhouxiangellaceae bacterium]